MAVVLVLLTVVVELECCRVVEVLVCLKEVAVPV